MDFRRLLSVHFENQVSVCRKGRLFEVGSTEHREERFLMWLHRLKSMTLLHREHATFYVRLNRVKSMTFSDRVRGAFPCAAGSAWMAELLPVRPQRVDGGDRGEAMGVSAAEIMVRLNRGSWAEIGSARVMSAIPRGRPAWSSSIICDFMRQRRKAVPEWAAGGRYVCLRANRRTVAANVALPRT